MNKNNIATIISIAGIIILVGGLFYLGSRNRPARPVAVDSHGMPINTSVAVLNDLINKPTPAFSFFDRDGKIYSSENLRGKTVLLFFNEGLMCYPACWDQIVALGKDERFKNDNIAILSVVADSKEDWQTAVDKMPELAKATVVFDNGASASKEFSVLSVPSSMHPGSLPGHTYVLIDKEGVIRYVFDDPNMGIRNDQLAAEIFKLTQKSN